MLTALVTLDNPPIAAASLEASPVAIATLVDPPIALISRRSASRQLSDSGFITFALSPIVTFDDVQITAFA